MKVLWLEVVIFFKTLRSTIAIGRLYFKMTNHERNSLTHFIRNMRDVH